MERLNDYRHCGSVKYVETLESNHYTATQPCHESIYNKELGQLSVDGVQVVRYLVLPDVRDNVKCARDFIRFVKCFCTLFISFICFNR